MARPRSMAGPLCTEALFRSLVRPRQYARKTCEGSPTEFEPLHSVLIRHEQVLLAQAQQSAGCNASHTVEARMCRWLLRIRDLTGSDEMELTQEFLSQMLGVRRTSVSLVANTLQKADFIRYRRGHIKIVDADKLKSGACECYEKVKQRYETLVISRNGSN